MRALLTTLTLLLFASAHAATLALRPGQTGRLGSATVTLLRVQDSRCPMNARCIQAGELRTQVLVRQAGRTRLLTLTLPGVSPAAPGELHISGATGRMAGASAPLTVTFSDGR